MKEEFDSILKIVSEDCSLFRKSDDTYTVPPIFINQFIEHCLQYNLREVLYMYLDHHEYVRFGFVQFFLCSIAALFVCFVVISILCHFINSLNTKPPFSRYLQ